MGVQLPEAAMGVAVGVLIFSLICCTVSSLQIWLLWVHRERDSFVAFLAYFTLLSTVASITQQLHTMIWWNDVKVEQWEHSIANIGSIEVAVAGPSVGLDLVLFYIQYFSYNAEALLTLFWSCALAATIYGIKEVAHSRAVRYRTNAICKAIAILVPVILLSCLKAPSVRRNFVAFVVLANVNMLFSLTMGALVLLAILAKYVHTRRQLLSWNVDYGANSEAMSSYTGSSRVSAGIGKERRKNIYDQWLVVRFTVTFIMLGIFEIALVSFQLGSAKNSSPEAIGPRPNLSAERAKGDFILFMPGCAPSLLLFLVFGTTTPFRDHMRKTFLPQRWQGKDDAPTTLVLVPLENLSIDDPSEFRKSPTPSVVSDDDMPTSPTTDRPVMLRDFTQSGQPRKEPGEGQWSSRPTTTWPSVALTRDRL